MVLLAILKKVDGKWDFKVSEKNMVVPAGEKPWVSLGALTASFLAPLGTNPKYMKHRLINAIEEALVKEAERIEGLVEELEAFVKNPSFVEDPKDYMPDTNSTLLH